MPSVFSHIIAGDLPARFVYQDERAVAFLSIAPVTAGHVLVVPRAEVDHWESVEPELAAHLFTVAQIIGGAAKTAFQADRVGLLIAGFEVPHTHLHVFPAADMSVFDLSGADPNPDPAALDDAAARIRAALVAASHGEFVPQ